MTFCFHIVYKAESISVDKFKIQISPCQINPLVTSARADLNFKSFPACPMLGLKMHM